MNLAELQQRASLLSPTAIKALLAEADAKAGGERLFHYRPYAKQAEFHAAGARFRERALIAANQVGKTWSAGAEIAMHATGIYPDWWKGKRFDRPTRWTCGSESAELTKKGVQRILLGPPESKDAWGTGLLPRNCINIDEISPRPGVPDAVTTIPVRHVSGGQSVIQLASYDQGRTKWQADTLDGAWLDEEPPEDVYMEALTRTNVTLGPIILTLTPLMGMSSVVARYLKEKPDGSHVTRMTLDDAEHYTPEQRKAIVASYPAHEREARTKGIPSMGSGRIFPVTQESISIAPFALPWEWKRIAGLDFGADHPTAAAWIAWDSDTDTVYIYDCYRQRGAGQLPMHASAIKSRGQWIPVAWPHDGLNETAAGPALANQYRAEGVNMRPENAKLPEDPLNPNRSRVSVEAGLLDMLTRMETGKLKVFSHLSDWFEEFLLYHRKNGKIVKEVDDIMSATRYGIMDLRFAEIDPARLRKAAPPDHYYGEHAWMAS